MLFTRLCSNHFIYLLTVSQNTCFNGRKTILSLWTERNFMKHLLYWHSTFPSSVWHPSRLGSIYIIYYTHIPFSVLQVQDSLQNLTIRSLRMMFQTLQKLHIMKAEFWLNIDEYRYKRFTMPWDTTKNF